MVPEKLRQIVRQFGENGLKLLLENPLNVVDLLRLGAADIVPMIEPGQLTTVQTTFVQSDYRHVQSDVVLAAPLRRAKTRRLLRRLLIYIMIECLSTCRKSPPRPSNLKAAISVRFCDWSSSGAPVPANSNLFWTK
jgi:hypothetical protein